MIKGEKVEKKIKRIALLTTPQIRGKLSKSKGMYNENRSIAYILEHYYIYGVPDREHIYITPRGTKYHSDLFSTVYKDNKGREHKAGFDLCAISNSSETPFIWLIQVKSTRAPNSQYINALINFPVNENVRKLLFTWYGDELGIIELC